MNATNSKKHRLLIVSNRLPFTVTREKDGLKFKKSTGGLVSGISSYANLLETQQEYLWIGWPGISIPAEAHEELREKALYKFKAYPVFLSEREMEKFYHGFCNKTIWPLFHYFPSYVVYDGTFWKTYKHINETFCDTIIKILKPDDIVWIHDYHLMLLPKLLREKMPELKIGFFLHIPFPPYEIFRLIPKKWNIEILHGLLGSDVIGFHTYEYTQYFLQSVLRTLGYEHNMGQVSLAGRVVKVDTFPIGIEFDKFYNATSIPAVQKERNKFNKILSGFKIILSIDRLDYTKGIINRLHGFELFLENNPQWHKKVVLLSIVVPSRIGVERYQQMKNKIDELVGKINGKFGSIGWTPIIYQYRALSFNSLVAIYSISDVALITPLRDGMNLIAKEYIATRTEKTGVLILAETAGASKELGESIIINPNHKEETASAIKEALEVPLEEQISRNEVMQSRLKDYDVIRWANDFIQELLTIKEEQKKLGAKMMDFHSREQIFMNFKNANRRIIFLDYDGTLVPFAGYPQKVKPDKELLKLIKNLSEYPKTEIVLISGRDRKTLDEWFGMLNTGVVAEHGTWVKEKSKDWQLVKPLTAEWKLKLLPILKVYVDRLPGSFVEEKEFSIVYHYRRADPEYASLRVRELIDNLVHFTANIDVQVLHGNKVVEIRNAGINKGTAGMYFLAKSNFDFILAIGDDETDEDLFRVLPDSWSVKVGLTRVTKALFSVDLPKDVLSLLRELTR